MNYGEVFSTWSYLAGAKEMVSAYQTMLSHFGDEDLKKLLEEATRVSKQEEDQIEQLFFFVRNRYIFF